MRLDELDFPYPEHLVATERSPVSRVLLTVDGASSCELENGLFDLVSYFEKGDVLVVNDTKVLSRRLFSESGLEILFLSALDQDQQEWAVLCPSSRWKPDTHQILPGGVELSLIERGRPQKVRASAPLTESYFDSHGDLPLPPYIQKARSERRNRTLDKTNYQTAWATVPGSLAAPTASLHFSNEDLGRLREKGVVIVHITLHVGLGTFLPVTTDTLEDHIMHAEFAEIPQKTWAAIIEAKAYSHHVWALGTTVTRTIESAAAGLLEKVETDVACEYIFNEPSANGFGAPASAAFWGETKLFIRPGYEFKIVDRLLTNFHQPRSTLLALVGAFAGLENVKRAYAVAIEKNFRLFSYGDLSAWIK